MCVQTTVDVSPQHQAFVFGKDRFHVQRIINKTNCLVSLPDPQHSGHLPPARRGTVYIQGNINNVVAAREMLIVSCKKFRNQIAHVCNWTFFFVREAI